MWERMKHVSMPLHSQQPFEPILFRLKDSSKFHVWLLDLEASSQWHANWKLQQTQAERIFGVDIMRLDRALYSSVDVCPWEYGTSKDLPSLFGSFRYPPLSDSRLAESIYRPVGHFGPLPVSRTLALKLYALGWIHVHFTPTYTATTTNYKAAVLERSYFPRHFLTLHRLAPASCIIYYLHVYLDPSHIPLTSRIYLTF